MNTEPTTADHKVGDIVNGHRLTEQNGTLAWLPVEAVAEATTKKKKKSKWPFIAIGAVALVVIISTAANGGNSDEPKAETTTADKPAAAAEAPKVTVPDMTGMTAAAAAATLEGMGFTVVGADDPEATVLSTSPSEGGILEQGATVTLTVESKPKLTLSQENAIASAENYLAMMGFSRSGLIEQLEYEEYSTADATFAVDHLAPDWNAEAAESAKSYLDMTSFSSGELYDQLVFEGFTDAEANAGLAAVGY